MKPKQINQNSKVDLLAIPRILAIRESVANTAAVESPRETAIANALDPAEAIDFSDTSDGWFKISPYGTFRGKTPGRPQVVTQACAEAI